MPAVVGWLLLLVAAGAGPRDPEWAAVAEVISMRQPQTAVERLRPIEAGAFADGAWAEGAMALLMRVRLENGLWFEADPLPEFAREPELAQPPDIDPFADPFAGPVVGDERAVGDWSALLSRGALGDELRPTLFAMRCGTLEGEAVTAMELMVQPNPPRFLREGDTLEFPVRIVNQGDREHAGLARLTVRDPEGALDLTETAVVGPAERPFRIPAGESRTLVWRLVAPDGAGPLRYKALAGSGDLSDGEEGWLPVLPRMVAVLAADPRLRAVLDAWRDTPALESPLERNQDLSGLLLEETPWLRAAQDESRRRRRLGEMFDEANLAAQLPALEERLKSMQRPDGLWPWFAGGDGSEATTLTIVTGIARLRAIGALTGGRIGITES